jgi:hypothetical protein
LAEWSHKDFISFPKVLTAFGDSLAWVLVGSGEILVGSGVFWWGSGGVLVGFWWVPAGSGGFWLVLVGSG